MASNMAAWNTALGAPLKIMPAPLGVPAENQILVKNHAIAINPVDGKLQYAALYPMVYPTILGEDIAGEVIAIGPGVTRFKIGDRVAGLAVGHSTKQEEEKAFQTYTILQTNMAAELPQSIAFENAAVLGLGISTAADALLNTEFLALQLPTEPAQRPTGKTLLIWGGASSVGSNAIQLAVASGYEVVAVASSKNFEYVKKLGARLVFDYNSPTIVPDLIKAFRGKDSAGAFDAIGGDAAWLPTLAVVERMEGVRFVATVMWNFPTPPEGVTIKKVLATSCKDNFVGKAVWEDYLPSALRSGSFIPAPDPLVVGTGLDSLQHAVNIQMQEVSARKVVVAL